MTQLSNNDLYLVQNFIATELHKNPRVKRTEVFDSVYKLLETSIDKTDFLNLLSANIKSGVFAGLKISRGRSGGIIATDPEKIKSCLESMKQGDYTAKPFSELKDKAFPKVSKSVAESSTEAPMTEEKKQTKAELKQIEKQKPYLSGGPPAKDPSQRHFRWLWIKDSRYAIPLLTKQIEIFLHHVMGAKEDLSGTIVFNGKKYVGDEQLLHRFLNNYIGCVIDTSEPLLEMFDSKKVPIVLIDEVYNNPSPQVLQAWNEKTYSQPDSLVMEEENVT